jgi:hypothetical protein
VVTVCTPRFNFKRCCVRPTEWIYELCKNVKTNNGYIPLQLQWLVFTTEKECVYCVVRTESLNIIQIILYLAVPWRRLLVAGLSSWRHGFYLNSVHVRFGVDRGVLGQFFQRVHWFSFVSFIQPLFYTHFHLHVVLTGGQTGKTWEHYKKQCSFGNWGALDKKVLSFKL